MKLTIGWFTNRREPKFGWFYDSLSAHLQPGDEIEIIGIDFYADEPGRAAKLVNECSTDNPSISVSFHAPYPNVWQGKHRLTKENHFNAAGARNTAICLCQAEHLIIADDLSVVTPGWLPAVKEAVARGGVTLGCYGKLKKMVVEAGRLISFEEHPAGVDHRIKLLKANGPQSAYPTWFFGCSVVLPIEAALKVGGFPEALCASLAYEDAGMSKLLTNNGYQFTIDPRMMTYESEEMHHSGGQHFVRLDPCRGDPNAVPRDDMSHAMLRALENMKYHPNYFGPGGIRGLRERVLKGEPFPITQVPEHCWFTGIPLRELTAQNLREKGWHAT